MQMSISSPWQGKNHPGWLGEHVRKQSLITSHPRKKGEHSNNLPRHKTTDSRDGRAPSAPTHLPPSEPRPPLRVPYFHLTMQAPATRTKKRVNPDLVSTRPLMLELSRLQTHRPPITSQPTRLASIPLRNTTRLRHLLPTSPSTPHLDTLNPNPPPNLTTTNHPVPPARNSLQHRNTQPPTNRLPSRHNTHPLPLLQPNHRPQPRHPKHSRHHTRNRRPTSRPPTSLHQQGLSPINSSKQEESLAHHPTIRTDNPQRPIRRRQRHQPRQLRLQPQSPHAHNNRPRNTRRTTNHRRTTRDQSRNLDNAPSQTRRAKQPYPSTYSKNDAIIPIT